MTNNKELFTVENPHTGQRVDITGDGFTVWVSQSEAQACMDVMPDKKHLQIVRWVPKDFKPFSISTRDPFTDPQPGDILHHGQFNASRTVVTRTKQHVIVENTTGRHLALTLEDYRSRYQNWRVYQLAEYSEE